MRDVYVPIQLQNPRNDEVGDVAGDNGDEKDEDNAADGDDNGDGYQYGNGGKKEADQRAHNGKLSYTVGNPIVLYCSLSVSRSATSLRTSE